ncbi:MAG: hypothetical protein JRI89_13750 [Deltaproteobacteria bacterium]|nr:hypothetical protein [Deltaproteobacteria bacterium]
MKNLTISCLLILVIFFANEALAANFNVSDVSGLRSALASAATNHEDDIISISAGHYHTGGSPFVYNPSSDENFALTIKGNGAETTILDGDLLEGVMVINTSSLADDSNCDIAVRAISFRNGNNPSTNGRGGLYIRTVNGDIIVERCTFEGNTGYYGGGLYALALIAGNATVQHNLFYDNYADNRGGGAYVRSGAGVALFTANVCMNNEADWAGGGVLCSTTSGKAVMTNNVFLGNVSRDAGGGARSYGDEVVITNNSFVNNSASLRGGGGLFVYQYSNNETCFIYNNLFWNNTAVDNGEDIYIDDDNNGDGIACLVRLYNNNYGVTGFYVSLGTNLLQGNNIHADPLLRSPDTGDVHLTARSPCIDAGNAGAPELPDTDLDGGARTRGTAPDIGADEYVASFLEGVKLLILEE